MTINLPVLQTITPPGFIDLGVGQIYLVYYRDYQKVMLHRQV